MASSSLSSPQSLNLYAYVENNPIDYVDPTGLDITIPEEIVEVPISFDDEVDPVDAAISRLIEFRRMVELPVYEGGGVVGVVNITADPDEIKITDVLLLTRWYIALKKMISQPRCRDFLAEFLPGPGILDVFLNVIKSGSIVWSNKIIGGQVTGAMDKPPINIKIHSRWLNQNNSDNFKQAVNTLFSEVAHATKEERSDGFMAQLMHNSGKSAWGLEYKGPEKYDLKTQQGRNAYEGYSSMWWHSIEKSYCNMFFVK